MRDFDAIEVSSGRRLRAAGVAALAAAAVAVAGVAYLHPRLPQPAARPKPSAQPRAAGQLPTTFVQQLTYAGGSLWFSYNSHERGEVDMTPDGGSHWERLYQGPTPSRVQVLDRGSAVITVDDEYMVVGSNGVSPTRPLATGLSISYAFADARHGLALLDDGSLYETVDGGVWHLVAGKGMPPTGSKHDLGLTPGGRAWFLNEASSGQQLYLSEDWGRSWRELTPSGPGSRPGLSVIANGEELFAGYGARVFQLLAKNAGWDELAPPPAAGTLAFRPRGELVLASRRQVYVLAADSRWMTLVPAPPEALTAITAGAGDDLYAAGVSAALYHYSATTKDWQRLVGPVFALPNSP